MEAIKEEKVDNANKVVVEPKFKVGDFIVNDYCMGKVIELTDDAYLLDTEQGIPFSCEHNAHLWTIEDAKDGDVLFEDKISSHPSPFIVIFKKKDSVNTFSSYCFIGFDGKFYEGEDEHYSENLHPATKEQRDLLFEKMHEAGYEWDGEKKELKKIEKKPIEDVDLPEFDSHLCLMFQKFRTKGICTNGEIIDYVKEHSQKLKDILVKPAWSEDDEKMLVDCFNILHRSDYPTDKVTKTVDWLKSIKDKYTWKPSDEQIELLEALAEDNNQRYFYTTLNSLYEQLKKLRQLLWKNYMNCGVHLYISVLNVENILLAMTINLLMVIGIVRIVMGIARKQEFQNLFLKHSQELMNLRLVTVIGGNNIMTQYISKSDLVAEIEKRRNKNARNKLNIAAAFEDNYLLSFLDTIEVKEVDLEKEIELIKGDYEQVDVAWNNDFDFIAKHFYELGLQARINKELVEEVYSHIDSIKDTADRMTSGNFMHNRAAIKFSANTIAKVLELIGLKAQKRE